MRAFIAIAAFALAAALLADTGTSAQDKKKEEKAVALKGKICCNKCELSVGDECATVIVVKDANKKDIVYFFDAASHKRFHDDICAAAKNGSVEGIVKDMDKKKVIAVKKVDYD